MGSSSLSGLYLPIGLVSLDSTLGIEPLPPPHHGEMLMKINKAI